MSLKQINRVSSSPRRSELRSEQLKIVKVFGVRMREARDLCGYTQIKAAKLLGYKNSSKLAKVEGATDTNTVPLWLIVKASSVYDVSTDFLFGFSDDWERDPVVSQQRQIGRWVFEHWERAKIAEVNAIRVLYNKLSVIEKAVSHAINRSKENKGALDRLVELNPGYDELRGGSRLLLLMQETVEEANGINYELKRIGCLKETAKTADINLDIFKDLP